MACCLLDYLMLTSLSLQAITIMSKKFVVGKYRNISEECLYTDRNNIIWKQKVVVLW